MARSNQVVNPAAENALDRMKFEVASELGIADRIRSGGWNTMTSADCGRVGGHMVRKMIESYESGMTSGTSSASQTGGTMTQNSNINS
ncbi:small, acid-soluble spore protein, alpha/beta type [Anaeroselena agilis]|uniref:Alpha/beta-type small acid-soluble spore protein n=1 Tax=Anaeroselena agilis TaxID=3063788 RepID=A0ABU3NZE1_9FIRM|nr:alpha/beta-type small acid-soluble spore protein [Selenomonadales bacterium 4137-cl]